MKHIQKLLVFVLLIGTVLGCLSACDNANGNVTTPTTEQTTESTPADNESTTAATTASSTTETTASGSEETEPPVSVDYAASVKLDMDSNTLKQEVTVKTFVDGDTTHFFVPDTLLSGGVLKARYLAVNTPESTGKIEEWGKAASNFTKSKLSGAQSIIIESDTEKLNADSTGDRYLVWVWYRTSATEEYRNLNIEILQNGLAIASNSANNRYGSICMDAINQAKTAKLHVYSKQKDPDFYYGEAIELTLKELRCNIASYKGMDVAFNGIVTVNHNNGVYVESYDEETDMWYGMYVYYGFNLNGAGMEILSVGNEVRIVGSVQFYEAGGSYQIADVDYRMMKPNDPSNLQKLSDGHQPAYVPTDPNRFATGTVNVIFTDDEGNEIGKSYRCAELAVGSSISMTGLKVKYVSTTTNEESSQRGAMTLTCEVNGVRIKVRTAVLYDESGNLVTADYFEGKTVSVQGIIDFYMDDYQIKVFSLDDITFQ